MIWEEKMLRTRSQSYLRLNILKRSVISLDTFIIGVYLILSPIDYALGEIITSFSFINLIAIALILVRICKKDFWNSKPKDFLLIAVFYFYNVINILLFSDILMDAIFLLFGLCFFFVNSKEANETEIKFFRLCILLSIIVTIATCFFSFRFERSNSRFYLNFSRYVDPNYFTCGFIVLTAYLMHRINQKKTIILDILLLVCLFIIILASGSRGGLLANLGIVFVYLLFSKLKNIFLPVLLFVVIFYIALSFFKEYIPKWILERFEISAMLKDQGSGRVTIWYNYWNILKNGSLLKFIFGYGKKNQLTTYQYYFGTRKNPHNMFLGVFFNSGIIGLILLLFVLGYFSLISLKNKNLFSLSLIVGLVLSGLTLDMNVTRTFWIVLTIIFMVNFRMKKLKDEKNATI